jgi:hypothetical protein
VTPREIADLERYLTPEERQELFALVEEDMAETVWRPLPGPQTLAYESQADVIGFGGAAGGGKTDLALGKALTQHHRVQMFRREGPQLKGIIDRLRELDDPERVAGNPPVYKDAARDVQIEFNSVPNLGDERKYQGRPKDLLVIDEAANFLEAQVRFLKGWVRTTRPGQRTCTLMTFNPPTDADGRWVIDYFAPWLDKRHALYPTTPGALRWVYVDPASGKDVWIEDDDSRPFVLVDGERLYHFDHSAYLPEEIVQPESRTFIPSRITDNPFLVSTAYMTQLQALPEPLRSQMLLGDFSAGMQDDPYQVVPTSWVEEAMARWRAPTRLGEMLTLGTDVARGGRDNTCIATRHKHDGTEYWFDKLKLHPGKDTPNGQEVAGLMIAAQRDKAPMLIDVIGVGASPYDILIGAGQDVLGVNASEKALGTDKSGRLSFFNQRSEDWWRVRELLDPANNHGVCLPPDPELLKELCAPRWTLSGFTIKVESREDIVERVGRSPDRATAVILAARDAPKRAALEAMVPAAQRERAANYDPVETMLRYDSHTRQQVLDYDPTRR